MGAPRVRIDAGTVCGRRACVARLRGAGGRATAGASSESRTSVERRGLCAHDRPVESGGRDQATDSRCVVAQVPPAPARHPEFPMLRTPSDYGPPASRGALRDLAANLLLGLRAAVFLRVRRGAWRPFPAQIVLLALVDVVVTLLLERAAVGADAVFRWDALPRMLLPVPLALLAGWIIAGRARFPGLLPFVATAALAVSFWFDLGWMALSALEARGLLSGDDVLASWSAPAFWWGALAAGVVVARLAAHTTRERLADCGWAMLVLAVPLWWIPYVPLWQVEEAGGDEIGGRRSFGGRHHRRPCRHPAAAPRRPPDEHGRCERGKTGRHPRAHAAAERRTRGHGPSVRAHHPPSPRPNAAASAATSASASAASVRPGRPLTRGSCPSAAS